MSMFASLNGARAGCFHASSPPADLLQCFTNAAITFASIVEGREISQRRQCVFATVLWHVYTISNVHVCLHHTSPLAHTRLQSDTRLEIWCNCLNIPRQNAQRPSQQCPHIPPTNCPSFRGNMSRRLWQNARNSRGNISHHRATICPSIPQQK